MNVPIFTSEELDNIFNLYDLKQEGRISRFQCKEALQSIASTQFQFQKIKEFDEIPDKVDIMMFKELSWAFFFLIKKSETVLGCK